MIHVAVLLAVHKPDWNLLSVQLESYRRQRGVMTSLFAVLDGDATCRDQDLRMLLLGYGASLIEATAGLGVRRAFLKGLETALSLTADAGVLFAFMDQDDRWYEQKLAASIGKLLEDQAELVHCDARVVDAAGSMIAPSLHALEKRQHGDSLLGAILLNTVTGMTSVFTRSTAETGLLLAKDLRSNVLHDHLLAVAASARGRITFLDTVLLDYVSHGKNVVGPVAWRKRSIWMRRFSLSAVVSYCNTTSRVFNDRRAIVEALDREGWAPQKLCELFLLGRKPTGLWNLSTAYIRSMREMKRDGRSRCANWLMRFFPLTFWYRLRKSLGPMPEK